ncbi:hypothetical protein GEMRC1_004539 [Eukaryota sp. GEM-RC1]
MNFSSFLFLSLFAVISASSTSYFLYLSDLHYDPHYLEISEGGKGGDYCRKLLPLPESARAVYGRPDCDPPYKLMVSAFDAAKKIAPKPPFIVFGGDMAAHSLHSSKEVLSVIRNVTEEIASRYPNTPIISCLGNNDVYPHYQSINLKKIASIWGPYLYSTKSASELSKVGFYRWENDSVVPNMVFLVLNTNIYSTKHHRAGKHPDPDGQFEWLTNNLRQCQAQNTKVIIIGHISPGHNAKGNILWQKFFTKKYISILNSYGTTVIGQFFGHMHADDFRFVGDQTSPIFLGGALSPIRFNNPNFRVVSFDESGIVDLESWYIDLLESNRRRKTEWKKQYSVKEVYGMKDLTTKSLVKMINDIEKNDEYWNSFINYRSALFFPKRFDFVCNMRELKDGHYHQCLKDNSDIYV